MSNRVILDVALRSSNDAFAENPNLETIRILKDLIETLSYGHYAEGDLVDINGNKSGSFLFEVRDED